MKKIKNIVRNPKAKRFLIFGSAIFVSVIFFLFIILSSWIGYDVKRQCGSAKIKYGGNCVEALSSFVDDEKNSLKQRNQAVWALGHLGDKNALPVLQKYYTGEECQHDKFLCQYELKKAIKQVSGEPNLPRFVWRSFFILDQ